MTEGQLADLKRRADNCGFRLIKNRNYACYDLVEKSTTRVYESFTLAEMAERPVGVISYLIEAAVERRDRIRRERQNDKDRAEAENREARERTDRAAQIEREAGRDTAGEDTGEGAGEGSGADVEGSGADVEKPPPFVGWRGWKMVAPTPQEYSLPILQPMSYGKEWTWDVNHAMCAIPRSGAHSAPDPECGCGFWAYKSAELMYRHGPDLDVKGVVAAWGRCEDHVEGYRAEYMQIVALIQNEATDRLQSDGWELPVPVMTLAECEMYVYDLGLEDIDTAEGYAGLPDVVGQFWDPAAQKVRIIPVGDEPFGCIPLHEIEVPKGGGRKELHLYDGKRTITFNLIPYGYGGKTVWFWWKDGPGGWTLDKEIMQAIQEYGREWLDKMAR